MQFEELQVQQEKLVSLKRAATATPRNSYTASPDPAGSNTRHFVGVVLQRRRDVEGFTARRA